MKVLSVTGPVDVVALAAELAASPVAPAGTPQRWRISGELGAASVFFDDSVNSSDVQTVLTTHMSQASVDARAAAKTAAVARVSTDLSEFADFINDPTIVGLVNQSKAQWITWAGTNFPTLTSAERTRLGTLFWVVSIGVRKFMR